MATVQPRRRNVVEDFIKLIEAKLYELDMEVKELAEQSGVSREYIHRILARKQTPTLAIAEKIAKPLGLSVQILDVA